MADQSLPSSCAAPLVNGLEFIPGTRMIEIGNGVVYRPVRSWHAGNLAGEHRLEQHGDRSGCIVGQIRGLDVTLPPKSVTHRIYWHRDRLNRWVSAFLSYPYGMSPVGTYHWEVLLAGDVERFDEEGECEQAIIKWLCATPVRERRRSEVSAKWDRLWTRIGRYDRALRRSTWARINEVEGPFLYRTPDLVESIEICSGREGDDAYVKITPDNPAFVQLLDVISYSIGNVDEEPDDHEWYEDERQASQRQSEEPGATHE